MTLISVKHYSFILGALMIVPLIGLSFTIAPVQAQSNSQTPPQVQWVGDVPIKPDLTIEPGLGFAFDSPEGRVVMVLLNGAVSPGEISAYYDQALEPLGWEKTGTMRWRRDGEMLLINETEAAGSTLWKITLRPE